jgi:hypothetical protein
MEARHAEFVVDGRVVADASTSPDGIRRYRDASGQVVASRVDRGLSEVALGEMDRAVFGGCQFGYDSRTPQDRAEGRGAGEGSGEARNAKDGGAVPQGWRI